MELIVAFLIAFGVIGAEDKEKIQTNEDARLAISMSDLDKEYLIWEAEGDDF